MIIVTASVNARLADSIYSENRNREFLMRMIKITGSIIVLIAFAGLAFAHPVEPCRARLAQLATTLKDCQLSQVESNQCQLPQQQLDEQRRKCRQRRFTNESLDSAIDHGFALLQGDVGQSPYLKQVRKQRWENSLMKPNIENFVRLFPDFTQVTSDLMERFNSSKCPKQYEGGSDRYLFINPVLMTQYPDSPQQGEKAQTYTVYFMQQEEPGHCYAPTAADGATNPYKVVNLPNYMLLQLERRDHASVIRCQSLGCATEQAELEQLYSQYQNQYRRYRQLTVCADIDQRNDSRKSIKGKKRSSFTLPDYCPKDEIQVKMLNAKGNLEQLQLRLFQAVTIRIGSAKSE
jgi:hypothetical protein